MQYLRFYEVKSSSTSDLASRANSILVPSDETDHSLTESTDSLLIPEMKKSQSANLTKLIKDKTEQCELLAARLLIDNNLVPMNLRLHMRLIESTKPEFIYHFIKRADNHIHFIETTVNRYNIRDDFIILRGFKTLKDSRWTYIQYAENQIRCTLKPQLYTSQRLHLNALSSPYVAVNFHTITSYNGMFAEMKELTEVIIENFDTSNIRSMEEMFIDCIKLESITFINCDFSSVETMANLCNGCISLRKLHFINCKLNLACDYWHMLYNCPSILSLKFPSELYNTIMEGTPEDDALHFTWEP